MTSEATDMPKGFSGAIFDVDGVLVDSPHERSWREALRKLMEGSWSGLRNQTTWTPEAFTPQVYQGVVSGKSRMSGALAALEHFQVPDAQGRVQEYADFKQAMVVELIEAGEFTAYPDALRFILAVKESGIEVAAASSSKNAGLFLRQILLDEFASDNGLEYDFLRPGQTLLDFFDADVSGRDFAQGKPNPEMFVTAARELGRPPQKCFVIEDAVSGVQAAKAGGMSALGLARADDYDLLAAAHPDLVVTTLDDVDIEALREGRLAKRRFPDRAT
jgi:beta-phosphoglucomutase